jgi:hypothetical protein
MGGVPAQVVSDNPKVGVTRARGLQAAQQGLPTFASFDLGPHR